jgi:membrane-bound lytic murein transglycosylase
MGTASYHPPPSGARSGTGAAAGSIQRPSVQFEPDVQEPETKKFKAMMDEMEKKYEAKLEAKLAASLAAVGVRLPQQPGTPSSMTESVPSFTTPGAAGLAMQHYPPPSVASTQQTPSPTHSMIPTIPNQLQHLNAAYAANAQPMASALQQIQQMQQAMASAVATMQTQQHAQQVLANYATATAQSYHYGNQPNYSFNPTFAPVAQVHATPAVPVDIEGALNRAWAQGAAQTQNTILNAYANMNRRT